jgi:hypothetical protein
VNAHLPNLGEPEGEDSALLGLSARVGGSSHALGLFYPRPETNPPQPPIQDEGRG